VNPASAALRILLAEDNPGDVYLVKEALRQHSIEHELVLAEDGISAWKLIDGLELDGANSFDICILDLNLPVRDGLELAARIRGSDGRRPRTLILIMSSSNSARERSAAIDAGADYYFCKPSNLAEFLGFGAILQDLWKARQKEAQTREGDNRNEQAPYLDH
jgi:CheY-like chemotaxis protein